MKKYLLSDKFSDLEILITGGLKPEYYIRKIFFTQFLMAKKGFIQCPLLPSYEKNEMIDEQQYNGDLPNRLVKEIINREESGMGS